MIARWYREPGITVTASGAAVGVIGAAVGSFVVSSKTSFLEQTVDDWTSTRRSSVDSHLRNGTAYVLQPILSQSGQNKSSNAHGNEREFCVVCFDDIALRIRGADADDLLRVDCTSFRTDWLSHSVWWLNPLSFFRFGAAFSLG
jgi:hypothetical protein